MGFTRNIFVITVLAYQLLSNCGVCEVQDCKAKLDMVIIVDSSLSVGLANFRTVIVFLKSLIGALPVQPDGIRVSLIRYASRADVISYLDEDMNQTEKIAAVASMAYRVGGTYTHLALKKARTAVLTPERGDRPDVPNLVILTTDGISKNESWTTDEAAALKANDDLKIFVIGIGREVADTELVAVASRPEMVYKLSGFSQLAEILGNLARFSCSDMKEESISELKAWPNSGAAFNLPVQNVSSASKQTPAPSTASSTPPSTLSAKTLTSTSFTSTSSRLLAKSDSTYGFRSSMFLSTLDPLTNRTTLPSTEFDATTDTVTLSTTQEQTRTRNDLNHSSPTTQALILQSSYISVTEKENNTEWTLEQSAVTEQSTSFDAKTTHETELTFKPKIFEQPTTVDVKPTYATVIQSKTHVFSTETSQTSSTDAPANSTTQTSLNITTYVQSAHGKTHVLDDTLYLHTRPASSSVTSISESTLADTEVTQSNGSYVTNVTELFSSTESTSDSSARQQIETTTLTLFTDRSSVGLSTKTSTIGNTSPSLVTERTTVGIPTDVTITENTSSSYSDNSQITTTITTSFNNLTSTSVISTSALSQKSKSTLGKSFTVYSWTPKSPITTTFRRTTGVLIGRASTVVTQNYTETSLKSVSQRFTNATPSSKHYRTTLHSPTTFEMNALTPSVSSPTQRNTVIYEFETYVGNDNASSLNNTTTENMTGETGGDVSSRDVYIFIAGGSATTVVLIALSTFLAVLCRKRNSSRDLDTEP